MRKVLLIAVLVFCTLLVILLQREQPSQSQTLKIEPMVQHYTAFYEPTRYGGWPANHGIWNWGDEILISFQDCEHTGKWENKHSVVPSCERYMIFSRSLDGGRTWKTERPSVKHVTDETKGPTDTSDLTLCPGGIDFSHPDFCASFTLTGTHSYNPSWWLYSLDRGRTWSGPHIIDNMGFTGVNARTDYHVLSPSEMLVFLTVTKANGDEGRVICAKLSDGGATWTLLGTLGEEPSGFEIMPASARRKNGDWVVLVRIMEPQTETTPKQFYIGQYVSSDGGASWRYDGPVTGITTGPGGNPPALVVKKSGAWCFSYGWREKPYGIRYKVSHDEGRTWGEEQILRDDAACWDIGYTRMVENASGQLVVGYYYNTTPDAERVIAVTVFDEAE